MPTVSADIRRTLTVVVLGASGALAYVHDRLAVKPAPSSCRAVRIIGLITKNLDLGSE